MQWKCCKKLVQIFMGSTKVCAVDEFFAAAYGSPHELDVRSFGCSKQSTLDEIGTSSGSDEGISADLGLTVTSTNMEANSFNMQSMTIKSSSFNCSAEIKGPKKPDRTLPCPRCNSLDTKFCYYNNYNVNQPRHFCKGCQRYWTAGGTLRNVAVGAGRRKRKHSSLESESATEVSSVEHCHAQDASATRRVLSNCGSTGGSSALKASSSVGCGVDDLVHTKPGLSPFGASSFTSDNLYPVKVQGSLSSDLIHAKQSFASQHNSAPLCGSHDNRVQASVFHEFIQLKHGAASSDKHAASVDLSSLENSNVRIDVHKNEDIDVGSKLVLAMPSERQASNESGCASSLTTQGVSVDVCANDGKSDAMDSEVTKEGEECDKGGFLVGDSSQSTHHAPCETSVGSRSASALCGFSHCDVSGATTLVPPVAWKRPPENPACGAAWAMLSMPLSWGSPTDRGLFWGLPWGPAASAVDAAKAALIPNARALQRWPQSETSSELPKKTQTVADKEFSQKFGESNRPSEVRVWAPKTLRIQDADAAARSSIWSTLGIRDGQGSLVSDKKEAAFQCHAKEVGIAAVQSQYANPAALSQSMTFQESS